ncbi:uncharacterized protein P884DRAFT_272296 [Thermothelomyces heterothallicus CBS 202.75]|uniref:uncharacterized protein n=1 Tax=Thermothelomyces heterothallicus CBS 202.75 TaxID=1149848 RepID=UPI003743D071
MCRYNQYDTVRFQLQGVLLQVSGLEQSGGCPFAVRGGTGKEAGPSGTYNAPGPGYLVIHVWTRNPLIEYNIVESHGELVPNEPWTARHFDQRATLGMHQGT